MQWRPIRGIDELLSIRRQQRGPDFGIDVLRDRLRRAVAKEDVGDFFVAAVRIGKLAFIGAGEIAVDAALLSERDDRRRLVAACVCRLESESVAGLRKQRHYAVHKE